MILFLVACLAPETDPVGTIGEDVLVLTTTDYSVGNLATVDLESHQVSDLLDPVGGDPVVRMVEEDVVVLRRDFGAAHKLVFYEVDALNSAPRMEIPLPNAANPHDVVWFDGAYWVASYDHPELLRYDEYGKELAGISLAGLAEDGNPEAHQLWVEGGGVHVLLQQFDRDDWTSDGGQVVRITSDGPEVVQELGPNPTLDEQTGLVRTGLSSLGEAVLDGALGYPGEPPLVTEAELGQDIEGVASVDDFTLLYAVDPNDGFRSTFHCLDRQTGTLTPSDVKTPSFVGDLRPVGSEVWVALRTNYLTAEDGVTGILRFDPVSCSVVGEPIQFTLDPYSLAVPAYRR